MADFSKIPWIQQHIDLYRNDPVQAHDWDSSSLGGPGVLPTLLLTTKGRSSGEPRALPLIYGKAPEGIVVIASKGGMPDHPHWFLNLMADATCEVQVAAHHQVSTARVAEGEERERLWKMMAEIYPPYDEYKVNAAPREIPVVVLEGS